MSGEELVEWGYVEDFDRLIEDLSGAALLEMSRHGITSPRLELLIGALGVCKLLRDESDHRRGTGGSGGPGGRPPGG